MARKIKILLLEKAEKDTEPIEKCISTLEYRCNLNITGEKDEYIDRLKSFQPDVVISDFNLSNFDGLEALKILRSQDEITPFIFVGDTLSEENAVGALRAGATDLIINGYLQKLPEAILRAIRKKDEKLANEKFAKQQEVNAVFVSALLRAEDWKNALLETFPLIGETLNVDSVSYHENLIDKDIAEKFAGQTLRWTGRNIKIDLNSNDRKKLSLQYFKNRPPKCQALQAIVSELPEGAEKRSLSKLGILSFIEIPVFTNNILRGYIGLDDCTNARTWDVDDVAFLEELSNNLAVSILNRTSTTSVKNSEQRFKTVISNMPGITYRCLADDNWTMQFVSDEIERMTGYAPDDFINNKKRTFASIIHPDDLDKTYLIVDQLKAYQAFTLEYRLICADGTLRWIEERGLGVYDDDNRLQFIDGVIMDVTDKKKANDKFQAIFDQTTEAIFLADENGNYIEFNKAAIKLFGYSRKELSRMNVAQLMGIPWDDNFSIFWEKFLETGQERGTLSLPTKNGPPIYVSHNSVANILPGIHLSVISNITEKVQREVQIRASERKFKALVQEGSDLLSILDLDANYLFVSESSTIAVLGFAPQDLVGKNAFEFIHPEDKERVFSQFSTLKDKKQINISAFRFRDANHQWHFLATTATNLLHDPAVGGIVANTRDVTESIFQKDALKHSNERFELAMKATNEMIWDWDLQTDQITRGRGFEIIFGALPSTSNGHPNFWLDNIHEQDIDATRKSLKSALDNPHKAKWEKEYRMVKADGKVAYIVDRGYIIRDEQGKAVRVVGAVSDITKSREMLHEISQQNKALKEIAWTQSHLVRAPLARLQGLVNLLMTENLDRSVHQMLLENIGSSAMELDNIIRSIVKKTEQIER